MILDTGALIAVARNDRSMIARLFAAHEADEELRTHAMVIAQAWRDGRRQASLARLLQAVVVASIDESLGRRCGELLAKSKTADPIDAAVVLIAREGEAVLTSDPSDISLLARTAKRRLRVIEC
jgi:predicted nucleic acid-binding protein